MFISITFLTKKLVNILKVVSTIRHIVWQFVFLSCVINDKTLGQSADIPQLCCYAGQFPQSWQRFDLFVRFHSHTFGRTKQCQTHNTYRQHTEWIGSIVFGKSTRAVDKEVSVMCVAHICNCSFSLPPDKLPIVATWFAITSVANPAVSTRHLLEWCLVICIKTALWYTLWSAPGCILWALAGIWNACFLEAVLAWSWLSDGNVKSATYPLITATSSGRTSNPGPGVCLLCQSSSLELVLHFVNPWHQAGSQQRHQYTSPLYCVLEMVSLPLCTPTSRSTWTLSWQWCTHTYTLQQHWRKSENQKTASIAVMYGMWWSQKCVFLCTVSLIGRVIKRQRNSVLRH